MVWAKMPLSDEELSKIEESHRIRPYLVVDKGDNVVYAFQSSHTRFNALNNYQTYGIDYRKFGYDKNWIRLQQVECIPIDNLRAKMLHLSDHDLSMIEKRLKIQSNRGNKTYLSFHVPIKFCTGDVVQNLADNKMLHYVHAVEGNKLICYPISFQYRKDWIKIKINKSIFYIDFSKQVIIDKNKDAKIVNIANNGDIGVIERKRKDVTSKSKKEVRKKKEELIGTIFNTSQGKMMYLYEAGGSHYGISLICDKVLPSIKQIVKLETCEKIEVYDSDKIKEVVEFLYNYLDKPNQKLNSIYFSML